MVYQWKPGARIRADAQEAGDILNRLEREGRLSAKGLLDESRPENAPLHKEFEWNDGVAAENWREHQARHIIGSILVIPEKSEPVRGFFKIERSDNRYESVQTILESVEKTNLLLEEAFREFARMESKFKALDRLQRVWDAAHRAEIEYAMERREEKYEWPEGSGK